jgi:hypothetical protein
MRNSVLAKMPLAEAEPEPLTVANFTTKSLMPLILANGLVSTAAGVRPRTTSHRAELARVRAGSDPLDLLQRR